MTSRERLRTALRRRQPDRVPRCEQSYWPATLDRWRREGMPPNRSPHELFGLDAFLNFGLDHSLRLPVERLDETTDSFLERDADGVVHRHSKSSYGPPCEVDFLIKRRADWERVRDRMRPDPDRVPDGVARAIREANEAGQFCTVSPGEPVWWALRT
ncbi:MAG: hypothetical protein FJX74_25655, partial [Armatimonadetes bacterium]|nr:hypothetical protein [Armatimonadota bacterium]